MARRILVLGAGDHPTGERLKKCVAELLLRRLLADKVIDGKGRVLGIRRRPIAEIRSQLFEKVAFPTSPEPVRFIYEPLPAREVSGCKFVPPKTDPRPSLAEVRAGWHWLFDSDFGPRSPRTEPAA